MRMALIKYTEQFRIKVTGDDSKQQHRPLQIFVFSAIYDRSLILVSVKQNLIFIVLKVVLFVFIYN